MPLRLLAPRYWPTWLGLIGLRLISFLPYSALLRLASAGGALLLRLPLRYRSIARRNIALCLSTLTEAERERLLAEHFRSLTMGLFEMALAWWTPHERIARLARIEGMEHLRAAFAQGHGVILLSAHFTTLEMSGIIIVPHAPVHILYRPTKNALLAWILQRNRSRQSARSAIPRDDVRGMINALKRNEAVWYAPDQAYRKKGAEMVPFFGIPAATNTATSRLARMTQAIVLPYFARRLPGKQGYLAQIHPPLEGFPSGSPAHDAERFNHLIEAQIRLAPEQYLWIHRRFKGLSDDYPDYYTQRTPT